MSLYKIIVYTHEYFEHQFANSWNCCSAGMWTSVLPCIFVLLLNRAGFLYGKVFDCFGFGLKSKQNGLTGKGKMLLLLLTHAFPLCSFEGGVLWSAPAPGALFPGNIEAMTWKCVTLDPFSYEPCAHISQDPFPESLLVCPVKPSCDGCLSVFHLNEDAGTGPFYKVSPRRGTQQPPTCLLRRSRRPCCRSCSGRPVGLEESIGTISDIATTYTLLSGLLFNPKFSLSLSLTYSLIYLFTEAGFHN